MTREQDILSWLNRQEQRIKRAIVNDSTDELLKEESIQHGAMRMLGKLGYTVVTDEHAIEWAENEKVGGYWIYKYKEIRDTTGRS